jgi:hypothetical protein
MKKRERYHSYIFRDLQFKLFCRSYSPRNYGERNKKDIHKEDEVLGRIVSLARTQHGSRLVQNAISNGTKEMRQQIFDEMRSTLVSLMTDVFGNYVVEEMVDNATDEQLATIVPLLEGQMINLSEDKKSNYVIQKIIQMACKIVSTTNQMDIKDRLLTFMRNTVDAVCGKLKELSCHQSATRIIQCILKNFPTAIKQKMIHEFLNCFNDLVRNSYGTSVLQDALKEGDDEFSERVRVMVDAQLMELCVDQHGSFFLESFLESSPAREALITRIITSAYMLKLLNNSSAKFVFKKIIELSDGEQMKVLQKFAEEDREIIARQAFGPDFLSFLNERVTKGSVRAPLRKTVAAANAAAAASSSRPSESSRAGMDRGPSPPPPLPLPSTHYHHSSHSHAHSSSYYPPPPPPLPPSEDHSYKRRRPASRSPSPYGRGGGSGYSYPPPPSYPASSSSYGGGSYYGGRQKNYRSDYYLHPRIVSNRDYSNPER